MKIGFLGSARYSDPLDLTTEKKFRCLDALGELFVIGFSNTKRFQYFTQHANFYALPLLPFAPLRYLEFLGAGCLLTFWLIVKHDCRIFITQSPYDGIPAAIAKIVMGWFGKRMTLIVESHGDFENDLFGQRRILLANTARWFMRHVARFTLNRADALRAISVSTRQQLALWRPDLPVVQFMAWTDIDAFLKAKNTTPKFSPPILLYTGVLIPRKGVMHLVNAFAAIASGHPQVKLRLLGRVDDPEYVRQLQQRVCELQLDLRIEFVEEMPQQQLAQQMAQAYVFILPSLSEGLGRVVVEAMAAGTPVIGSRVGGIPDVIQEGKTGFLVMPGDETALADRFQWMLEHPDEAHTMGNLAHLFAMQFFSPEKYVTGYADLINAIGSVR